VPVEKIANLVVDMWKILKPGGTAIHSIDLLGNSRIDSIGRAYNYHLKAIGFLGVNELIIPQDGIFFENIEVLSKYYFRQRVPIDQNAASILVKVVKPE